MIAPAINARSARLCCPGRTKARVSEGIGMDWDDAWPGFAIAVLAALALALKAVFDTARLRAQLAGLTERFGMLDHRLVRLTERLDAGARPPETVPPIEPAAAVPAAIPVEPAATPVGAGAVPNEPVTVPEEPARPSVPPP